MRPHILITGILSALTFLNAGALEINVSPGSLAARIEVLKGNRDSLIRLKGHADVRDLSLLRHVSELTRELDISDLSIDAYIYPPGDGYLGRNTYASGELPGYIIAGTSVKRIILPIGLSAIAEGAFAASALEGIVIPASVTDVGDYIFLDSYFLTEADIPAVVAMSKGCFRNCRQLRNINVRGKVTSVAESFLEGCEALKSNPCPEAESYGKYALRRSGISSLDISSAAWAGDYAFAEMSDLTSVTLKADGTTTFGTGTFYGDMGLQDLPEWNADIPPLFGAKTAINLSKRIDPSVIGNGAFANNSATVKILLGPNVREICRDAFRNNTSLTEVNATELGKNIPVLDHNAFAGRENDMGKYDITLFVNQSDLASWEADPEWSRFNITGIDASIQEIRDSSTVYAARHDDQLIIITETPVDNLEIYTLSGLCIYKGVPRYCSEFSIPAPPEMLIVRIKTGDNLKIIKIP